MWYYSGALMVSAGWLFTTARDLSSTFEFNEMLTRYPNLSFPVLGVMLVNLLFVVMCATLGYRYAAARVELYQIHEQLYLGTMILRRKPLASAIMSVWGTSVFVAPLL